MESATLTKSADDLLCGLYKVFRQREKSGEPREKSRRFKLTQDVSEDLLRELSNAGFIRHCGWDGLILEDAAIVYMENKPTWFDKALHVGAKIKGGIPFT